MKISEVQVEFIKPQDGIIGFASLVIDNSIYVSSIAVHRKLSTEDYRLIYPSKGKFTIFYPINRETSEKIELAIITKLKEVMSRNHEKYNI